MKYEGGDRQSEEKRKTNKTIKERTADSESTNGKTKRGRREGKTKREIEE